jgi:hypothetical protein
MHLSPPSDDDQACYTVIDALRRMQYGLIATVLAVVAAFVIKGVLAG